jgi:hypothetical protein
MKVCLKTVRNENGSAILVVVFVLAILTIIGISASNTTDVELNIAGNDRSYRTAFYGADSGNFATAKRVSHILDTSDKPLAAPDPKDGLMYNGATPDEFYDKVLGLKNAANIYWDPAADINFSLGGVDAAASPPVPAEPPVGLPETKVAVDLKRLKQYAPAGEAAEFGTGAEAVGGKTVIVIPYALASEGKTVDQTKARIRCTYFKYFGIPGGV